MRRSQASATFIPAPAAAPLTAATIGLDMVRMRTINCDPERSSGSRRFTSPFSRAARMTFRSPPDQKARPAPVRITTRTLSSAAARARARSRSMPSSTFSALSRSGRFSMRVCTPPSSASRTSGAAAETVSATARSLGDGSLAEQGSELLEVAQFFGIGIAGVLTAGGGKHEHLRAVEFFLLQAELARAAGKFFVSQLAIEGDHPRMMLFELLRKHHAAFRELFPANLFDAAGRPFDDVGEADAEFDQPAVVLRFQRVRHQSGLVKQRPELVAAAGIVMAGARRGFAGIEADHQQFHAVP